LTKKIFIFFSSFLYAERLTLSTVLLFNQKYREVRKKYSKSTFFNTFFTLFALFFTFFNTFLSLFDRFSRSTSFLIDAIANIYHPHLAQTAQINATQPLFLPPKTPSFFTADSGKFVRCLLG